MSIVDGNIITAPVSVSDVATVLGVSSYDVGTLCSSSKINMWAKWKPVPLRDTLGLPDELDGNDGWRGNPISGTNRPWWFGGGQGVGTEWWTYDIPVISELEDIGNGGTQNNNSAWKYRRPDGNVSSQAYRLTDFVGYKHDARPPFTPSLPTKLYLNSVQSFGLSSEYDLEKYEFNFNDIKNMLGQQHLYLGIAFWNRSTGIITLAVNTRELDIDDEDSWWFNIEPGNAAPILGNAGVGQTINIGNTVDVFLFLSPSAGSTSQDVSKYSALLETGMTVYRRYTGSNIGEITITLKGLYSFTALNFAYQNYTNWYYTDGDNQYRFNKVIVNISSRVSVRVQSGTAEGRYIINLVQYGYINGKRVQLPTHTIYSEQREITPTAYTVNLNDYNNFSFVAYSSLSDMQNERNPQVVQGIPIIEEIIYNFEDASLEGTVSSRKATIGIKFSPSQGEQVKINWEKESGTEVST